MSAQAKISLGDLQRTAKALNSVDLPDQNKASSKASEAEDAEAIEGLEAIYDKYDGDLDDIFNELGANPTKAKKPHNRPKNKKEFALKFYQGFYNLVEDEERADEKSHK